MSLLAHAAVQVFPEEAAVTPYSALAPRFGLEIYHGSTQTAARVLVGLTIPYLPSFLEDYSLVGASDVERLAEILDRHVQFIANLWKWQSGGFSLRVVYEPSTEGVELALLARTYAPLGAEEKAGAELANDLISLGSTLGLTMQPVERGDDLNRLRVPFGRTNAEGAALQAVEVRQREDIITFSWAKGEAYIVYPLWRPLGTFIQPLQVLLRQRTRCVINLHLEPTRLSQVEYETLASIAASSQTIGDWQRTAHSVENTGRWADPQARIAAQIFAAQLRRLTQPFVVVAQVFSADEFASMSLAQALGAAITTGSSGSGDDKEPTSQHELVIARSPQDVQAAQRTLEHLILTPWGADALQRTRELTRLRYLADARGAAAVFRFPVAVRGGVPGIEVRQEMPGYDHGRRAQRVHNGQLDLGQFQHGGSATIRVNELTRHGLIAGLPGGGKTNTCLYLLTQLHGEGIPFLVIEPTKTEYRGLIKQPGFEKLLIFTLGDETTAPFRLNPFELLPGIRLEVHLEGLNTVINAAMPQFGVLSTIIEEALEEVYSDKGWKMTDRGAVDDPRLFPTMQEFYRKALQVVERRGYRGEVGHNILAAVKGRIGSLLRGSKGRMFNCRRSLPLQALLNNSVILEMDSLGDDSKALTTMFLLLMLREYRQSEARGVPERQGALKHLLLIEEAHRVMENVSAVVNPEVSADTRGRAVRMLVDFLVEMRGYGQGILIAEQSPEKLAPDAVRNTNLKLAHMLPGRQDREALASAMIMDEEQERFIGKLRVGQAALFMTGFEKASFIAVPPYKNTVGFDDSLPDSGVKTQMEEFYRAEAKYLLPFDGCRFCGEPCLHRAAIEPVTRIKRHVEELKNALLLFDAKPDKAYWEQHWMAVAQGCTRAAAAAGKADHVEAAFCFLAHEVDFPFTAHMRREFVRAAQTAARAGE